MYDITKVQAGDVSGEKGFQTCGYKIEDVGVFSCDWKKCCGGVKD